IRKVAAAGKPLIISTGMAEIAELDEAIRTARQVGIEDIILLKCTSTYPASPENSNIMTIPHMRELFKVQVGLSDHSLGIGVAVAGVALGATMIEKHFTLDRSESGVDAAFSMEPAEMKALVEETTRAWQALGKICYGFTAGEHQAAKFRRSLYIVEDMKEGEVFTPRNLRAIRPGLGLAPKYYDIFIGKKVSRDVRHGTPLSWDMLC
ncbi:MAG: N-acetylneuraminate synthase family protein, partial [candidate division Zixibacteria bacterium]|nr:N-acetylneuraminate synthase family protein [candidate division Zixibacteria bacterium]